MEGRVCTIKWLGMADASQLNFELILRGIGWFSAATIDALPWQALKLTEAVPVKMEWKGMVYMWSELVQVRHDVALRGWTERKVLFLVELKSGTRFILGSINAPVLVTQIKNISTSGPDSMGLEILCRQPFDAVAVV